MAKDRKYDYSIIKKVAGDLGVSVRDLLALSPQNDPFYVGTPADVERAKWFYKLYKATGYGGDMIPHLRRIHYWIISQSPVIKMPDGKPYENTERCWDFLGVASKAARYLGLIPIEGIRDNKNPDPHVYAVYNRFKPQYRIDIPEFDDPDVWLWGFEVPEVQPYHIEIWVEKSTMDDVLLPVCERFGANLVTFLGEVSLTAVCVGLVQRIAAARKPARIFYISDFDPAGNSMPVAMSRKLEYSLRNRVGALGLDVKVKPLALTADQVEYYSLPRIPIKESERRAAKFEEAFGGGAVELDALEAIHPGVLAQMVEDELEVYYSDGAELEVTRASNLLREDLQAEIAIIFRRYEKEIEAIRQMVKDMQQIPINAGDYAVPQYPPEVDEESEDWLFDSNREYVAQIAKYKQHKGVLLEWARVFEDAKNNTASSGDAPPD